MYVASTSAKLSQGFFARPVAAVLAFSAGAVGKSVGHVARVTEAALNTSSEAFWAVQRHAAALAAGAISFAAAAGRTVVDTVKTKYGSIFVKTRTESTVVNTSDDQVRVKRGRR